MVKKNPEAGNLRRQRVEILSKITEAEKKIQVETDKIKKEDLISQLINYKAVLKKAVKKENDFKNKIFRNINRAVSKLAKEMHVDYIFNVGDSLIYSRREYDITERVIREIARLKKKNLPVSK